MKIKVNDKKWYSRTQFHNMERLAKHVMEHYPKDTALHKAVWSCFKSCEQTERKLWTGWKAGSKKTAKPRKSTARRRTVRRAPAKRRTARRSTAKRRTTARRTARRSAPKRRTAARRTYRRTARRTRRSA